jgi:hypothetical protein
MLDMPCKCPFLSQADIGKKRNAAKKNQQAMILSCLTLLHVLIKNFPNQDGIVQQN